ncbi:MAG TPA: chromosome segregation protein SMC [Firmicutes bacterium]|nr:chromosome segregation protein SMC [Bacillota bacterium]
MYLKRIELSGFKSFADRVELEFGPGITAIVGPNGSGKSNISDAIRWVLGEQSAKLLRGSRMEDVIFVGSDGRRPLGMAEVTLTLDNSDGALPFDFHELAISRRVFRSGEGEYFINKVPCRLKDIVELFAGTGVGREGYSIIEQGRIDSILSLKAEDRRAIFEEASGISKYKLRKQEALKRLESVKGNLLRVQDILNELYRQLGPLAEKARNAERYRVYASELRDLEVKLYSSDFILNRDELDRLRSLREERALESEKLRAQRQELACKLDKLNAGLAECNLRRDIHEESLSETLSRIERCKSEADLARQRLESGREQADQISVSIETDRRRLDSLHDELLKIQKRLETLRQRRDELTRMLSEKEEEDEEIREKVRGDREAEERAKADVIELLSSIADTKNRLAAMASLDEANSRRLARLRLEAEQLGGELKRVVGDIEARGALVAERRARIASISQAIAALKTGLEQSSGKMRQLAQKRDKLVELLHTKNSHIKALSDLENAHAGYSRGARAVLDAAGKGLIAGVLGVVASIIDVPGRYVTAIEVALGRGAENIVTRSHKDAEAAVEFLKRTGSGRATFLPLDMLRPPNLNDIRRDLLGADGVLGLASDLISYDPVYRKAIEYLLGRIVVTTNLEAGIRLSRAMASAIRIVTLDGDMIHPGGAITGGSQVEKALPGLVARRTEIEAARREVEDIKLELSRVDDALDQVRRGYDSLNRELAGLEAELKRREVELSAGEAELRQLTGDKLKIERQLEAILADERELEATMSDHAGQRAELEARLSRLAEENRDLERAVSEMSEQQRRLEARREALSAEITDIKVELAALRQEESSLLESRSRLEHDASDLAEVISAKTQEVSRLRAREEGLKDILRKNTDAIRELEARRDELGKALDDLKRERREMASEVSSLQAGMQSLQDRLAQVMEELHKVEVDEARLSVAMEQLGERLRIDYGLVGDAIPVIRLDPGERDAILERLRHLRGAIEGLGPVSLDAIEEYASVSSRYESLRAQYDDLVSALDSVDKLMGMVEDAAGRQFLKVFGAIKDEFARIFSELFGGGYADLVMQDAGNPLETGIDVVAQPPGKRLQSISLLSGGEKALTAIAVIFAILKVRPSPFCVLDEIDAALDEVNIGRFVELLRKFARDCQFIVVTHRRGTMEAANILYGVTMEKSGISKLISLSLEDKAS